MKNIIKIFIAMSIVLLTLTTVVSQSPVDIYTVNIDDTEVNIEYQGLSQEKLDVIINDVLDISTDPIITPYINLLCLFGHSTTDGMYTLTSHSVSSTAPRCRKYTYEYVMCSRSGCDYYSSTLIDTEYLYCH